MNMKTSTTETTEPEGGNEQSFDDAFAEAIAASDAPAAAMKAPGDSGAASGATPAETGGSAPAGEAGTATTAESSVAAEEGAAVEGEKAAEPAKAAESEETPDAKIARLEAELVEARKPAPAAPAKPAEPDKPAAAADTPAEPQVPAEPQWYKPSAEEEAALKKYAEDWPDHVGPMQLHTKIAVYNAVQYVFSKMAETYNPILKRFGEMSDTIAEQLTLGALRSEHEDYDEIYNEVLQWIPTLPAAFRYGAEKVMKEGTPEEVAELITSYKDQKKAAAAASGTPTAAAPTAPAAPKTELSAPAKKAAKALTVVGSKRTSPVAPVDANDFDGAWAEAVNATK